MKKCAEAKKKNCRQTRKRKEEGFFDHPFFCPFLSKSKSSSKSARSLNSCTLKHRFFSSFCASSFFFLLARSIHSSHFSLVARARAYIYISKRAISTRFTRETRREKEREGKKTTCTRDDDPGGKREEEERKIESFFRSGRLRESERRREKEREETRLSSSFQTI